MAIAIFLSTVSDEFRPYRDRLAKDLRRHPDVEVTVQEDFGDLGTGTLEKLDTYIAKCDAVIHLVGDMTGTAATQFETDALLRRHPDLPATLPPIAEALASKTPISYTQWEAWLALYHHKLLLIAKADPIARRPKKKYAPTDESRDAQTAHLGRLESVRRYPGYTFKTPADLATHIAYTAILDLLAKQRAERLPPTQSPLDQKHLAPPRPPTTELDLLLTDLRALTLVGRDQDLAALDSWRDSAAQISVRVITGRAGAGKTRLAIEACAHAATAGWEAGFAPHNKLADNTIPTHAFPTPTLIVIDYAAAATRPLRPWLETLAKRPPTAKLRLLLLERHAEPAAGWFQDLFAPTSLSSRGPDSLLDPPTPIPLAPLNNPAHRRALLAETIALAAPLANKPALPLPPPGADPEFDRQLATDTLDHEPLYLAMAGLVAVTTGAPAALALGRLDLAHRVAAAERTRLHRLAQTWSLDPTFLTHLAACLTL